MLQYCVAVANELPSLVFYRQCFFIAAAALKPAAYPPTLCRNSKLFFFLSQERDVAVWSMSASCGLRSGCKLCPRYRCSWLIMLGELGSASDHRDNVLTTQYRVVSVSPQKECAERLNSPCAYRELPASRRNSSTWSCP